MQLITATVPDSFNLFNFGDLHYGSELFYRTGFDKLIDMVCSEYEGLPASRNFCVDHGDSIEAIDVTDKRFCIETNKYHIITPLEQADDIVKMLNPIKKKIVCKLEGNHEFGVQKFGPLTERMCIELGVQYGTSSAKIAFQTRKGELIFKQYASHPYKSINSTADDPKRRRTNMELILKRHLKHKFGDCLLMSMGHTHKLLICSPNPELYLTDDGSQITQKYTRSDKADGYIHPDHRWYINTGSFLKLYGDGVSGYAERAGYDPVELGFIVVMVRDRKIVDVRKVTL